MHSPAKSATIQNMHHHLLQTYESSTTYPFEGCEKRLVIHFDGNANANLRIIPKSKWIEILKHAQCTILSTISNNECTAHLLSESSLFVFSHKLMIKTCGTTALLMIIPIIINECKTMQISISNLFYSHSNFMFPLNQPCIYQSFDKESNHLKQIFDKKEGTTNVHTFGSDKCKQKWHCFEYSEGHKMRKEQTLEIVMFDLSDECMQFYFERNRQKYTKQFVDGYVVDNCAIPRKAQIDSYLFDECGYSLNALLDDKYWSIHITPEKEASFVSFETNFEYESYSDVIREILSTFKPKRFGVAMNMHSCDDYYALDKRLFDGFELTNDSMHALSANHDVGWMSYRKIEKKFKIDLYLFALICVFCLFFLFSLL